MAQKSLHERACSRDLASLVQNQDYDAVIKELQSGHADVNQCLSMRSTEMTGLEHSVYEHDWRMASIFLLHGADPARNKFTRLLQMFDFSAGNDNPVPLQISSSRPDLSDLHALVEDEDELSLAYLWLMTTWHRGSITLDDDFARFQDVMGLICGEWFDREALRQNVYNSLLIMKRRGIPCYIARKNIEDCILRLAQGVLKDIAFEDSTELDLFMSEQRALIVDG